MLLAAVTLDPGPCRKAWLFRLQHRRGKTTLETPQSFKGPSCFLPGNEGFLHGGRHILYLLFLIVRACSELGHMPYVGECWSPTLEQGRLPGRGRRPSGWGGGESLAGLLGDWATVDSASGEGERSAVRAEVSWGPGAGVWLLERQILLEHTFRARAVGVGVSFSLNREKSLDLHWVLSPSL